MLTELKHTANITKGLAKATRVVCLVIAPAIIIWIIAVIRNMSGLSYLRKKYDQTISLNAFIDDAEVALHQERIRCIFSSLVRF